MRELEYNPWFAFYSIVAVCSLSCYTNTRNKLEGYISGQTLSKSDGNITVKVGLNFYLLGMTTISSLQTTKYENS